MILVVCRYLFDFRVDAVDLTESFLVNCSLTVEFLARNIMVNISKAFLRSMNTQKYHINIIAQQNCIGLAHCTSH